MKTPGPLFIAMLLAVPVAAQQPVGCDTTSVGPPDVMIRAHVTAERVRFETSPQVDVQVNGCAAVDSVRVLERRNLPDPVQPGVTYQDVAVSVEILGHLDLICGIDPAAGDSLATALTEALQGLCRMEDPDAAARQ